MEEADEALLMRYAQRRTHRVYGNAPITLDSFSGLLSCLRRVTFNGRPKYLYPSSGGLYCIQSYLYVKAGRIDGVSHGTYYYDPAGHRLMGLCLGAELDRTVYSLLINRPVFDSAAFSIYLIAQLAAITPMYGEESLRLATLDAGYMGQLLVMTAPKFGMGLCPIGSLEFDRISHLFQLEDSHTLIHSLLGGLIEPESPMDDLRHQPGSSPTLLCRWENGEV
jgi:SagB-type dehydrogenase family enzyme